MADDWTTHTLKVTADGALNLMDREWLLTNSTGAFAMGTVPGINTRRYHGLLVILLLSIFLFSAHGTYRGNTTGQDSST